MISTVSKRQIEIIEAAGNILIHAGVCGLTIKNLAKEMQFSESAIYRHFTSKEAIIQAMLEYMAQRMDESDQKALASTTEPEQQFVRMFRQQCAFFQENRWCAVAAFSDGLMEESAGIHAYILQIMEMKKRNLIPLLDAGQKQGVFNPQISAEDLAHVIVGSVRLMMFKWRAANFEFDLKKRNDTLIDTLLTLIKTK